MHWSAWNGLNCFGTFAGLGTLGVILSVVLHLAVIMGAVLLIAWFVRSLAANQPRASYATASPAPGPREILQQRYASGEVSREQYLKMLDDLS